MIITKLVLHKYKRFSLSNIKTLIYTPIHDMQLILATNGGGKSSLVKELSPLPADLKKDYNDDGYKEIHITHNNKSYILSSGIVGSNKHSFTINNTEYNNGGLRKIQLQLVYEHFSITPNIHEVLLGNTQFTTMNVNDRKKWLTSLSDVDYTYPLNVFNRLKSRHRDITGAMKITQNKLLQSDAQQLNPVEITKAKTDLTMLNKLLNHLLASKSNQLFISNRDVEAELKQTYREVNIVLSKIDDTIPKGTNVDNLILTKENDLHTLEATYTGIKTELDKILKVVESIKTTSDLNSLMKQKESLIKKLEELYALNKIDIDVNNISNIRAIYSYMYTDFISILNELHDHSDIYYSPAEHKIITDKIDKCTYELKILNQQLDTVRTELLVQDKYKNSEAITCVNCNHSWHLNFNPDVYNKLKTKSIDLNKKIENAQSNCEVLTKTATDYDTKKHILIKIKNIISNNKEITPILKYIVAGLDIQKDTNIVISNANEMSILLDKLSNVLRIKEELIKVENDIKITISNNEILSKINLDRREELEKQLSKIINTKYELTTTITKLKSHRASMNVLEGYFDTIKRLIKDKNKENRYLIDKLRNDTINDLINNIKYLISDIEKKLHTSELVKDRITLAKKELEEYTITERVLKIAIRELSPTEGLIAKSINSFLNVFINEINIIVNSVWNYDIRLLPCEVTEANDLDYKFPVMIDNNEIISDISLGSSSMKEIINLAFKVVFMKYLSLTGFPLILDEFAVTMDPEHRVKAFDAIDRLLAPNFSQIFIISHFKSMYGRFERSSDINILNSDNLELDDTLVYNKHMQIIKF